MAHRLVQQAMGFATGFGKRIVSTARGAPSAMRNFNYRGAMSGAMGAARGMPGNARAAWSTGRGRFGKLNQFFGAAGARGMDPRTAARMGSAFSMGAMPNLRRNMMIGAGVGAVGNMGLGYMNDRRAGRGTGIGRTMGRGLGGAFMGSTAVQAGMTARVFMGSNSAAYDRGVGAMRDMFVSSRGLGG